MFSFVIPTSEQFDFRRTVLSHGWLMLPPFSWDEESGSLSYVYQSAAGAILRLLMREADGDVVVALPDCRGLTVELEADLRAAVTHMLNINWDLSAFYAGMKAHAGYDWLEAERRGRILISPSLWEDLAKVLLTTNCSWSQTANMCGQLCQLGAAHPTLEGCHAFPPAERIAEMEFDRFADRVRAGYRSAYLHELATKIADGEVIPDDWLELDSTSMFQAVKSLKGFGDYAAGTVVRMYGHFDKIAIDTACHAMFAERHNSGVKGSNNEIKAHYARFGSWAGLVMWMDIMRHNGA